MKPQTNEHKKTMTYGIGNPHPALLYTHRIVGVKLINWIPTPSDMLTKLIRIGLS